MHYIHRQNEARLLAQSRINQMHELSRTLCALAVGNNAILTRMPCTHSPWTEIERMRFRLFSDSLANGSLHPDIDQTSESAKNQYLFYLKDKPVSSIQNPFYVVFK